MIDIGIGTIESSGAVNSLTDFPAPTLSKDFAGSLSIGSDIEFTRASTGTYFDANRVMQSAAIDAPRFDHDPSTGISLGLLIEESRINSIRNNTMIGAVAGTPGTLPTNWIHTQPFDGISREVVATGTTNGIAWIDLRYSGTASTGGSQAFITFDSMMVIAALQNQVWTPSAYIALSGGSTSGVSTLAFRHRYYNAVGAALTATDTSILSALGSSTLTRVNGNAATATDAITAWTVFGIFGDLTNGAEIDITIRIGLPQLELGAFATSAIATSGSALTRSADVASMTGTNFSSWYNQSEGTFVVAARCFAGTDIDNSAMSASDGTSSNNINIIGNASGNGKITTQVVVGGVNQLTSGAYPTTVVAQDGTLYTAALGYKLNDSVGALNGLVGTTDTTCTIPTVDRLNIGSYYATSNRILNGHVQRLSFYQKRLANTIQQGLSS